ncbi:MAG: DUF2905 domain-containing protein [Candidatus Protistobacter heckmanni]|nr:DUF2905 domain-containing protein [Candidatus Protistobacter heckmanni]MCS6766080.1 DUF2905 domain-containing protein [Candidatus Protistobacter heckmanni]
MIRWVFVVFLATVLLSAAQPWLAKLGIGRLPGDLRFRIFGREVSLPFASSLLISVILLVVMKLF